ncbi:MAG: transglutaminase family protein [Pirellulales bacterium]
MLRVECVFSQSSTARYRVKDVFAVFLFWLLVTASGVAFSNQPLSVEDLVTQVRQSIVTIRHSGRGKQDNGLGTGFVVSEDGLIATNMHVIGEARPITVELPNGQTHEVITIHAFDKAADLAVIRIDSKTLVPLLFATPKQLSDGQEVVAVGNPHGLERSVVTGRLSATRQIDGIEMLQIAIPIESGNSGGPLLDRYGNVHGILTMKSLVTPNLGFAVAAKYLRDLLDDPNPVLMSQWLTIGAIDSKKWSIVGGARWRQRAGALLVTGHGNGFGGRTLCLNVKPDIEPPCEMAVRVKLDDESGAAGLAFASDGGERHYGFYPSGGKLRLTRFDGPDVFSWNVLEEVEHTAYRLGEWNHLRVKLTQKNVVCFVNDEEVIRKTISIAKGRVGLVSFRGTEAEFRGFEAGREVSRMRPPEHITARVMRLFEEYSTSEFSHEVVAPLVTEDLAAKVLMLEAAKLDRKADSLRTLAATIQQQQILERLSKVTKDNINVFDAALIIAQLDNPELDGAAYTQQILRLASEIKDKITDDMVGQERLEVLDRTLFEEKGFHGSRGDYYNPANSYVNEVLDDREGIPITLSIIYMELARQMNVSVQGIGFPGHFLVQFVDQSGETEWIDVFDRGKRLHRKDLQRLVRESGESWSEDYLKVAPPRAILSRVLNNLLAIASRAQHSEQMLGYLNALVTINADETTSRTRVLRMVTAHRLKQFNLALADARWLVEKRPDDVDLQAVGKLIQVIESKD